MLLLRLGISLEITPARLSARVTHVQRALARVNHVQRALVRVDHVQRAPMRMTHVQRASTRGVLSHPHAGGHPGFGTIP